jgi:protein-disulfide isomerase
MVMALVVGLGVGLIGGYMGAGGGSAATASKDAPAENAAAPGANNPAANNPAAKPNAPKAAAVPDAPIYIATMPNSPTKGPKNAKVTILEFSDFQ